MAHPTRRKPGPARLQPTKSQLIQRRFEARGPKPGAREFALPRQGQKLTLQFHAMNPEGAGVAIVGRSAVAVPFALPGEEALVEITQGGQRSTGKIVALMRKSPQTTPPRCRHFGVCGGCQWQHLTYDAQLEHKSRLVKAYLNAALAGSSVPVRHAVGADPWGYRNRIQATFSLRRDKVVAGYYALRLGAPQPGSGQAGQAHAEDLRVINVRECPIQHGENVRLLHAIREVIEQLGWPLYDRDTGRGLVRGVIGQIGFKSGEAMLILCTTREVPDRMALVRAVRDRLLNLTSLLLSVQPARTPELLGHIRLLWGREYLEDEMAGLRLRLYASSAVPPNPRALPLWLGTIADAAGIDMGQIVADVACEEGLLPVWLAARAEKVIGIAPDREAMHRAWENARLNGIENCVFYTRSPSGVLAKLRGRGERIDAGIVTARRSTTSPAVFSEMAAGGVRRVVCAAHSLSLLAGDIRTAVSAGYRLLEVRPVDLLPQTSRVHCVATLERAD